jgi:hypothetical protein
MLRRRERELLLSPPPGSAYSRAEFWTPEALKSVAVTCEVSTHPPTFRSMQSGVAWGFHRGFVESVTMTAAQFFGGPCGACHGGGELGITDMSDEPGQRRTRCHQQGVRCYPCRGTGRVEGLAAALFATAPITKIQLSDKSPTRCVIHPPFFGWLPEVSELTALHRFSPMEIIPYGIWTLLEAISSEVILTDYRPLDSKYWKWFASEQDAITGLSTACVKYGRQKAKELRDGRRKFSKGNTRGSSGLGT